jgi:hypothetical protein
MFSFGGGKNGSKSKSTTDNSIDPWSKAQYEALSGQVKGLLSQPTAAYGGQLTAGVNPYETAAAARAQALGAYTPGQVSAGSFLDANLSAYTNPYLDDVLQGALGDIETSRRRQQVGDAQAATQHGAWNGARHGVADALTNEAALDQAAKTSAGLRSQAYADAAGRFEQDRAARLQADLANQAGGLQAAQLGLGAAGLMGQLGGQIRAGDQAGLDRLYADFQRLYDDPFKRAQVLTGLLGATPMIQDSSTRGKTSGWNFNWGYDPEKGASAFQTIASLGG